MDPPSSIVVLVPASSARSGRLLSTESEIFPGRHGGQAPVHFPLLRTEGPRYPVRPVCLLVMVFGLDPDGSPGGGGQPRRTPGPPGHGHGRPRRRRAPDPRRPRRGGRRDLAGRERPRSGGRAHQPARPRRPRPVQADPGRAPPGPRPAPLSRRRPSRTSSGRSRPADYNPAWFLVGDRTVALFIDLTDGDRPVATPLGPGVHILENSPLGAPSWKVDHVRSLLGLPTAERRGPALMETLRLVLADHRRRPPGQRPPGDDGPRPSPPASTPSTTAPGRPPSSASPPIAGKSPAGPLRRRPSLHVTVRRRRTPLDGLAARRRLWLRRAAGGAARDEQRAASEGQRLVPG